MTNILIRNIEDFKISRLDEIARQARKSRQEFLSDLITEITEEFDPSIVLGYVELKGGELGDDVDCPECGHVALEWPHIGFTGDLRPFGPVCHICATSD